MDFGRNQGYQDYSRDKSEYQIRQMDFCLPANHGHNNASAEFDTHRWIFAFPPTMDTIMPNGITIATAEPWIVLMIIIKVKQS
jgi:hypothetical protein